MLDQATRGEKKLKVLISCFFMNFFGGIFHLEKNGLNWFHWYQEEEQRLRKVALNISKDVKKFWVKIEKLVNLSKMIWFFINFCFFFFLSLWNRMQLFLQVLYKHQMELDEKKKKALDKQLEFLLGQTERWCFFFLILVSNIDLELCPVNYVLWMGNWICISCC